MLLALCCDVICTVCLTAVTAFTRTIKSIVSYSCTVFHHPTISYPIYLTMSYPIHIILPSYLSYLSEVSNHIFSHLSYNNSFTIKLVSVKKTRKRVHFVIKNGTFIATLLLYTRQFSISTLYIKNRKLEAL